MQLTKIKGLLPIVPLLFLISFGTGVSNAAVSKTSKRIIRFSANPALTVVPGFTAETRSKTELQWSWSTGSFTGSGIDGYKLYSSSTPTVIPLSLGTSFYVDSGLGYNKSVTRWITSYQAPDEGSDSEHIEKYTFAEAPATFELYSVTATSAYIEWHYSSATAYAVEYSTDGGAYYARNREIFVPWQTLQLMSNRNYLLRIGAVNGDDELTPGEYSVALATTTPPLDLSLTAMAISSYTIEWDWDTAPFEGTDITGFRIYKSSTTEFGEPAEDDDGGVIATLSPATTFWIETYTGTDNITGDTRHGRWIKAFGVLESFNRQVYDKSTYAVAPDTCGLTAPDYINIWETSLNLAWPMGGKLATKYAVEYSTAADFSVSLASFVATGLATPVTGLTSDTKYDFRIGAINYDGEQTPDNALNPEAYSDLYKVVTRPPTTPTVCSALTDTIISLAWSTATYTGMDYISGYVVSTPVYHADLGMFINEGVAPVITDLTANQYDLDYRLTNSTHSIAVSAVQTCPGYATYGALVINDNCATFATPPNDVSFDTVAARSVSMWWREPQVPATEYRVERSTTLGEHGPWVFVSSAAGTSYTDSGLSPSTTYSYRIGAINLVGIQTLGMAEATGGNRRDYSFVSSTMTRHTGPVMYGVAYGTDSISWSWDDSTAGVVSYNIYTSTLGLLNEGLAAAATFWIETDLPEANTSYTREIASLASDGLGELTEASAITLAHAPSALAADSTGQHTISLGWSGNGGTRYRVSQSPDGNNWTDLAVWADSQTTSSYMATGLLFETTYYFAVSAYNQDGRLSLSSAASAGIFTLGMPDGVTPVFSTAAAAQSMTATLPGVGQITVSIPAGSVVSDGYIDISTSAGTSPAAVSKTDLDAATARFSPNLLVGGTVVEFHLYDLYGSTVTAAFASPARLTFTYTDANNDDILDGITPQTEAATLKLLHLETTALDWTRVGNSFADRTAKTVYADIPHFSIYALGSIVSAAGAISDVFAYPNPYKPGSAGPFGQSSFGDGIVFESLPARSRIRIYSVSGGLVREMTDDNGDGRIFWDTRNSGGTKAASGVYLYLVKSPTGGKKSGRISIIR